LFYYDRSSRTLILRNSENKSGLIKIYSVNGQLVETFHFNPGQTMFVLSGTMKAGVGIVRMSGDFSSHVEKIIY
jgi:predicted metallopeptidase